VDPSLEIQAYLFALLAGDRTLVAVVADPAEGSTDPAPVLVCDDVPQGTPFPYVKIGDDTIAPDDDKTQDGWQHTATIHTWSRARGRGEVKRIMSRIRQLIHNTHFKTDSAQILDSKCEFQTSSDDGDGRTRHGIQRFRFMATSLQQP
jgi:Protein of unknown function (DUF3168)